MAIALLILFSIFACHIVVVRVLAHQEKLSFHKVVLDLLTAALNHSNQDDEQISFMDFLRGIEYSLLCQLEIHVGEIKQEGARFRLLATRMKLMTPD